MMRILRGLSSRLLACGCVAGVYETYDGQVVTIIDVTGPACAHKKHERGKMIPALDLERTIKSTSSDPR